MGVSIDVAWKSLNKHQEELCGDKVEHVKSKYADLIVLADGMGSGVKANILATLTSKILATMYRKGSSIELAVETIAKTLPICKVRQVAYSTFSILGISKEGKGYLVEFDNPSCIFIRDKKIQNYPYTERMIEGKKIREYRFEAKVGDAFILMSDGVIWAGAGDIMNYGWTWDDMASYTLKCVGETRSASRLAAVLSDACNELYLERPGDDTTIAVMRVVEQKVVNIFTGPPKSKEDDEKAIAEFMKAPGKKIVSGGTTSNIVSRVLDRSITTNPIPEDESVPPTSNIEGIDLVTEGVVTLGKVLKLLQKYGSDDFDVDFFLELDSDNGAAQIAKMIIEEATDIHLFVGTAKNNAYVNADLPFELSIRMNLIKELKEAMERIGKSVVIDYF